MRMQAGRVVNRVRVLCGWLLCAACSGSVNGAPMGGASGQGAADAAASDGSMAGGQGGSSGVAGNAGSGGGDAGAAALPKLFLSELMYHPVLEDAYDDHHEFVELHNAGDVEVALDGLRLGGGVSFRFEATQRIAAGGYLVVASDRTALLAVTGYALDPAQVVGNYNGQLGNDGDDVQLISADGRLIDAVTYSDAFPWPIGADALGAGESWLDASYLPYEAHRYRGRSLERASFEVAAAQAANWLASPLDGATPGRANSVTRAEPAPIVESFALTPLQGGVAQAGPLLRASDEVRLSAVFSSLGNLSGVQLEYFVDDLAQAAEPTTSLAMTEGAARSFEALLPAQPDNSIVRFRFVADVGNGPEPISPRVSDPNAWHAYFVSPVVSTQSRLYQLFLDPARWTALYTNLQGGRVSGCTVNPSWDARVPGVFVYEGEVFDIQVRYQGSRFNRTNGPNLSDWAYVGPTEPDPLQALSVRISFPRYHRFEGSSVVSLNKLTQGCPGYTAAVGFELFRQVGIPASHTRYARLHINGGYYHYMLEIERPDEELLERHYEALEAADPARAKEPVGHLFKSSGCNCDEGPFGWGDGRPLDVNLACPAFSKEERYAHTYERSTHDWADYGPIIDLVEGLATARAAGDVALKTYLDAQFDVDAMLSYLAVMNWAVPFDDMFQNHFLYQRRSDGKWVFMPWDLDQNFGVWNGADASPYVGEEGDEDNRSDWWNHFKDSFFQVYRPEFLARLKELNGTTLAAANVATLVDATQASASVAEAQAAPAGLACDFQAQADAFKAFAAARNLAVDGL
jgi:hypothetical protein